MRLPPFLEEDYLFPEFFPIQVQYETSSIENLNETVLNELNTTFPLTELAKGSTIAVAVGSRGIDRISELVQVTCNWLIDHQLKPVIVPAMGSHGGGTAEGQIGVLERLGVLNPTPEWKVDATMDVVELGKAFGKVPVVFGKAFMDADYSICINRIKPHTKFKGRVESGMAKMLTVGMGKHQGAMTFHKWALKFGFSELLEENARVMLEKSNFIWGLALVENAYDKLAVIKGLKAENLLEEESKLLIKANQNIPHLPVDELDVLVIQNIGKEISGAGMDPNVTGRAFDLGEDDFSDNMKAKRVVVLDLTDQTKGNAVGIGNADIITQQAYDKIDYEAMLMNALTGVSLHKAFIPVIMPNDVKAIQCAFQTIGPIEAEDVRSIIIQDTLHLTEMLVSKALLPELRQQERISIGDGLKLSLQELLKVGEHL